MTVREKACEDCGRSFAFKRTTKRFCDTTCRDRSWDKRNQEKVKQHNRAHYEKHKARLIAQVRARHMANPERQRERLRKYYRTKYGRAMSFERTRHRRAKEAGAQGSYTAKEWIELVERCGTKCLACNTQVQSAKNLTVDHIVPISRGGSNHIGNLQPLCFRCNCRKGTKTVDYRPQETEVRLVA